MDATLSGDGMPPLPARHFVTVAARFSARTV